MVLERRRNEGQRGKAGKGRVRKKCLNRKHLFSLPTKTSIPSRDQRERFLHSLEPVYRFRAVTRGSGFSPLHSLELVIDERRGSRVNHVLQPHHQRRQRRRLREERRAYIKVKREVVPGLWNI